MYEADTNCSFKIGRSRFKYNHKHVFEDGKKYKATPGMWELLTKSKPDRHLVSVQDKQAYKQILLQFNAHRVNYKPLGKIKANKGLKYTRFISQLFTNKGSTLGIVTIIIIMSLSKVYYDYKHTAEFGSVANIVKASKTKKGMWRSCC